MLKARTNRASAKLIAIYARLFLHRLLEDESFASCFWCKLLIFVIFYAKIGLENVDRLLVYIFVLVILEWHKNEFRCAPTM